MRFWAGIFIIGAVLEALAGFAAWPGVFAGNLNDPDSYMRLERIFQGVQQGRLINIVARDDSGAGVLVEWSRLLDALIWVMAAPLAPLLGWHRALFCAGVAIGPLGVGVLGTALAFTAEPLAASGFLWLAPVAAALLPGLKVFSAPGVVHYHVLLLAMIGFTAGFALRAGQSGDRWQYFLTGVCGGIAIWLTPETMPFVLMIFAGLLMVWVNAPKGAGIAACAAGFFDVLGFAVAIDPPAGGYGVPEIDRLSVVYVILALLLLIGGVALWRLERLKIARLRRVWGVGLMCGLLLVWVAAFPQVAEGPYGIMDAAAQKMFFGAMLELQPLSRPGDLLQFLLPGAVAVVYAAFKAVFSARLLGRWLWGWACICGALALILGKMFLLFVEFPAGFAAALLPVALSDASYHFRTAPLRAMLTRVSLIFLVLLLPDLPALAQIGHPAAAASKEYPSCALSRIGALLRPSAGQVVLANAAVSPELLWRSAVKTTGSLYQHGVPAYLRARAAWRAPPGVAVPADFAATGAAYVLFCPSADRYALVAGLPPTTLWDVLQAGRPIPWLVEIATDKATGWRLYQVRP